MADNLQVHYLEVVTPDVEQICASYSQSLGVTFGEAVAELGGARTATLAGGGLVGIRVPMHDAEEPTTRPYYLVADIEKSVEDAMSKGGELAVPPMEIPGHGKCAVLFYGSIQSGLWEI